MELSSPIFAKHGTLFFKCRRHINLKRSRKIQSMSELLTCSLSVARKPRFWSAAVLRYTPVQGDMNGNYTLRPQAKTAKWRVKTRQALEGEVSAMSLPTPGIAQPESQVTDRNDQRKESNERNEKDTWQTWSCTAVKKCTLSLTVRMEGRFHADHALNTLFPRP